ncbi:MAG TPA: class I SAM-dependent methyltransferase [Terriglobia bacterium]|nr:class I SAM-dependent methyltransferase [Terriglobia bacterium]
MTANQFRLYRCPACGVVFLHPLPTAEERAALYSVEYYGVERKKFAGLLEHGIRALTAWKWKRLRPLLAPGDRMLDIGCGRGTLVELARAGGVEAYGLERPFPGAPPTPHVLYRDLPDCEFPDGHFQLVVLWHVLEHLENPRAILQEIHRILRAGGWLSLAVPHFGGAQARASGRHWFHLDLPRHFWHFEEPALETMLQKAGFEIRRRSTLSFEYDWYGTIQSWMNRAVKDDNRLYKVLQGQSKESAGAKAGRLLLASLLAPSALASALWDASRGQGGTVTFLARRSR